MHQRRLHRVALAGVAVALVATACSPSGSNQAGGSTGGHQQKGGTLYIPLTSDFEHLDPARTYVSGAQDFGRLIYRTLTTYRAAPGKAGLQVVGDIAKGTGTPTDHARTWTFHLKSGIKYEDGSPVTCKDIKYGVERSFDPALPEGPPYFREWVANVPKGYQGPKQSGDLPGSAIDCPNGLTIVFHLNQPVGDFSYTVAFPETAPVPKAKDTGSQYDSRPFSSGPYKIQTYDRGKKIVLVRNKYWNPKTDPVRKAYPDTIVADMGVDPSVLDQRLISDSGQDQEAIMFGVQGGVQPGDLPKVLSNQGMQDRVDKALTPFTTFLPINMTKVPNLKVRQALEYLVNKQAVLTANGGKTAGRIATTISNPNVPGHQELPNLYPAPPTGNVAKAKQLLRESGVHLPLHLTLSVSDDPADVRRGTVVQAAFKRANVILNVQELPKANYYTAIGDRAHEADLVRYGWGADWPSLSTVLPPLFCGCNLTDQGNINLSQMNDPQIDKRMRSIETITDQHQAAQQWASLEKQILQKAAAIPLTYDAEVMLRGSKVQGAYIHPFYGQYDLATISVS